MSNEWVGDTEIRALHYSSGKQETVGVAGVNKIRPAERDEEIAGNGGYLTTYVVERYGSRWKVVPGWMVAVELVV